MKQPEERTEREQYREEVCEKWGSTDAYREHIEKTGKYTGQKWDSLSGEMNAIMAAFAQCQRDGRSADSDAAQQLVCRLQTHITEHYYHCTDEILSGLGRIYSEDPRFRHNIDKNGNGTAEYIGRAIDCFSRKT